MSVHPYVKLMMSIAVPLSTPTRDAEHMNHVLSSPIKSHVIPVTQGTAILDTSIGLESIAVTTQSDPQVTTDLSLTDGTLPILSHRYYHPSCRTSVTAL